MMGQEHEGATFLENDMYDGIKNQRSLLRVPRDGQGVARNLEEILRPQLFTLDIKDSWVESFHVITYDIAHGS